jgi:predicted ester cyclase
MGEAENERTIRAIVDAVNANDRRTLDSFIADDIVVKGFGLPDVHGREAHTKMQDGLYEMLPDRHEEVVWLTAKDDCVVARFKVIGTNTGPLYGMPPTGRRAEFYVNDIFFFDTDGLVKEYWTEGNALSLMQQLGVIPGPP